jgi:hypothetical protein
MCAIASHVWCLSARTVHPVQEGAQRGAASEEIIEAREEGEVEPHPVTTVVHSLQAEGRATCNHHRVVSYAFIRWNELLSLFA